MGEVIARIDSAVQAADGRRMLAAELADRRAELLDAETDGTVLSIARQRGHDEL